MNLGQDIAAELPGLRAQAESTFKDTFTVYRPTGNMVEDPETLEEVPEFDTFLEGVPGKFKQGVGTGEDTAIPGAIAVLSSLWWHTPISTTGVRLNDEIECTAVDPAVGDASLVGVRVRISGTFLRSQATARRYPVEDVN